MIIINQVINKHQKFIRFLFLGALNSAFGYGLFSFFVFLGLHYSLAALLATILGVCFNFFTTGKFVFDALQKKYIFRFLLVYFLLYILNVLFLKILLKNGLNEYTSGFILLPAMAILGYVLQSKFTFKSPVLGQNQGR